MTIEVETPLGLRSGSSIVEVEQQYLRMIETESDQKTATGKAVAVDLGRPGVLFGLLRSEDDDPDWAANLYDNLTMAQPVPPNLNFPEESRWRAKRATEIVRAIVLPRYFPRPKTLPSIYPDQPAYPMLVRFRDLSDPMSVEQVDPSNLAKTFGPGVRLRRIVVQITRSPRIDIVQRYLPWLKSGQSYLDGSFSHKSNELSNRLHSGDFKKE